jgi:thiol-disulfide isomerase/thioredoxin
MIGDAAQGRPIDALDIAELAISGASAAIPGLAGVTKTAMKAGVQAAKVTVTIVKAGQDLGMIPSSCLGPNCPAPPPPPGPEPPLDPPFPAPPPPVGQLTDEEIEALQPENTVKRMLRNPTRNNPDYIPAKDWIAQYRAQNYGDNTLTEPGNGALTTPEDKLINQETTVPVTEPPTQIPDGEELFPPLGESSDFPAFESGTDFPAFESSDFPAFESSDFPAFESSDFPAFESGTDFPAFESGTDFPVESEVTIPEVPVSEVPVSEIPVSEVPEPTRIISEEEVDSDSFIPRAIVGGLRGGNIENLPIIEMNVQGDNFSNPWGELKSTRAKSTTVIPLTHTGAEFNSDCYARKNPEVAQQVGNDKDKLTTHWIEIGAKAGMDADCGNTPSTLEQRLAGMAEFEKNRIKYEGMKTNCAATDRFWIENENRCDGFRHKDGRPNTFAGDCLESNSYYDFSGNIAFCNKRKNQDQTFKSVKELCNQQDNFFDGTYCIESKNVDGTQKTKADLCTGLDSYWNGSTCDFTKEKDGKNISEKDLCFSSNSYYGKVMLIKKAAWGKQHWGDWNRSIDVTWDIMREISDKDGRLHIPPFTVQSLRDKYGWRDVHPYVHKVLDIWWNDGVQDRYNAHIEYQGFPELIAAENAPIRCEELFFPNGRLNLELKSRIAGTEIPASYSFKNMIYDRNLGKVGAGKPKSLTLYWAEWCPHCHEIMPEWEKLGDGYKGVTIEAIEEQDSDVKVDGYPTIIFRNGRNMEKYEGERTKNAILKFLKNKLSIK